MVRFGETEITRLHRNWAKKAAQNFRCRFPELTANLYESPTGLHLQVDVDLSLHQDMQAEFEKSIRSLGCTLQLVQEVPPLAVLLPDDEPYASEIWLKGVPLSAEGLNTLLHIATPGLPTGSVDYQQKTGSWAYKSNRELSQAERTEVADAMRRIGLDGAFFLEVSPPSEPPATTRVNAASGVRFDSLKLSNSFRAHSQAAKQLVARDEDLWRGFLNQRSSGTEAVAPLPDSQFSCLFDTADKSEVRLSELLTIYDRVDIIPNRMDVDWTARHGLPVKDLLQLVEMGRCRVILPYGAEYCRPDILDGLASIGGKASVLTRELAAKTFLAGQAKDPFLYAPFTAKERSSLLQVLHKYGSKEELQPFLSSYGKIFTRQHSAFMLQGAMATTWHGIGSHLGELIHSARGIDARLELCTAGAGVEWAMALGSSWIPRSFSEGYDETENSHIIASFMSRTKGVQVDPVTSRLHALTQGLLAITDVPPLEIAQNFNGAAVQCFRTLARRLMTQAPSEAEMLECVEQINAEAKRFASRLDRLRTWKVEALAASVVAKPIGDAIDAVYGGGFASILVFWLVELLKGRLPNEVATYLESTKEAIAGFALAPSADAVVVSRSRQLLKSS